MNGTRDKELKSVQHILGNSRKYQIGYAAIHIKI
jgi:hypothetical protein